MLADEAAAGMAGLVRRCVIVVMTVCVAAGAARAQISPGPLSSAHRDLEGVKNCLKCHGLGDKPVDEQCLACHREIGQLRADGRGFHAREGAGACAKCHLEHGGLDFDVVHWGRGEPESFDHSKTGWPLDGKHAAVACEKCHRAELRVSSVAKLREGGLGAKSWLGLETTCNSCHTDPHQGRFGTSCVGCHSTASFHAITKASFDHERTRYPLRGKHREVLCEKCHKAGYAELPRFDECRSCHEDVHRGEATLLGVVVDCASCHVVDAFVPSTYDATRHAKAKYALEGRHAQVKCRACHAQTKSAGARFGFRPAYVACTSCHEAAHGKQLAASVGGGKCEGCHDVRGFKPSAFDVADHAKTAFRLEGAHAKAKCSACHGPERPGLAPLPPASVTGPTRILFHFTLQDCISCHHDPHAGSLGTTDDKCLACHDASAFRPARVDVAAHAKYEFALEGAHGAVPCFECHKELQATRPASTLVGFAAAWPSLDLGKLGKECRSCHKDPHGRQFTGDRTADCSACHGVDAFRPASHFDHDRDSAFALAGAHAKVPCASCHKRGALPDGSQGVVYRTVPTACEACHLPRSPKDRGSS